MKASHDIYWNLHADKFSVRDRSTGRVITHTIGPIYVSGVSLVVQPAGHARTLRERRKNVHAFVRGNLSGPVPLNLTEVVRYDPYKAPYWRDAEDAPAGIYSHGCLTVEHGRPVVRVSIKSAT